MLSQKVERWLPYRPEQLFDLAADVERYPEFLRWWLAARVRDREASIYRTDQVLGLGPIRVRFASKTVLHRPKRIDVTSHEGPFRRFRLSWTFQPRPGAGCRVSLVAELELRSRLLERVVGRILPAAIADIIAAFDARAHQLYEPGERSTENPRRHDPAVDNGRTANHAIGAKRCGRNHG